MSLFSSASKKNVIMVKFIARAQTTIPEKTGGTDAMTSVQADTAGPGKKRLSAQEIGPMEFRQATLARSSFMSGPTTAAGGTGKAKVLPKTPENEDCG
jgi:hypothetical protein